MSARRRRRPHRSGLRLWLVPIAILGGIALVVFASLYTLDTHVTGGISDPHPTSAPGRYVRFEPTLISDALSGLAGMTAAVLGIVITVVSLLVQLTSERYTGVAQMFLRDRRNVTVMAYYVVTCVVGVALSLSLHNEFVPRAAVFSMMCACAFGLIMMLPYFAYVFRFLEPVNLVARIEHEAAADVLQSATTREPDAIVDGQVSPIAALEELTDITSNSISGKDKIIASRAVDAIKDFILGYLAIKGLADPQWFQIGERIRGNPDFVAMDPESLRELESDKTWLEWKALRQYLGIYAEAQGSMPDINYLIAIDTRYVGEAALARGDRAVVELAFRFMNSYLRAALNARAVRTAYNVMNQYRLLIESMIRGGADDMALEGVRHMIYYGRTSYDMQLGFVTETVAYDVSALCEFAHTQSHDGLDDKMLAMFLELDQPLRLKRQESGLQGIRKAQIKLACYYLAAGAEERAARIAADMAGEDRDRLRSIRDQLSRVESKEFWEIIDRGRNFEYMPPRQKEQMGSFFAVLDAITPAS
ncbi:MAG: DUF2254 domain-containing protein [Myxococcales bacterium]|nr:DUF2254 domain-containing protein [Myxococcales bacterium]